MSFSTNSTNPLSAYNMTSNNLTAANLRKAQFKDRNTPENSSGSSKGSTGSPSQRYIDVSKKLFSPSYKQSKGFDSSTNSNSSEASTLSGRVNKNCSVL